MKIFKNIWIVGALYTALTACDPANKLETAINQELESGIKNDSLFMGIHFGWTQKEFYDHCWKMNKQGIFANGSQGASVLYAFKDDEGYNVDFNFFPEYDDGRAYRYNASFGYNAWSPWNKQLQSDDLLKKLSGILLKWYGGNDLFKVTENKITTFYKIDGNRQIALRIKDDRLVVATFIDLSHYTPYSD